MKKIYASTEFIWANPKKSVIILPLVVLHSRWQDCWRNQGSQASRRGCWDCLRLWCRISPEIWNCWKCFTLMVGRHIPKWNLKMNKQESDVECIQLGNKEYRTLSTDTNWESVWLKSQMRKMKRTQQILKNDITPLTMQLLWEYTSYVLGGLETKQNGMRWI